MQVHTVGDLIRHLPARYEWHWAEGPIADLPMEAFGSTRGVVVATRVVPSGRGRGLVGRSGRPRFEVTLEDHSGRLKLAWFHGGYLQEKIRPGLSLRVTGKTKAYRSTAQMVNPQWEVLDNPQEAKRSEDRLVPVYPATEGLPSRAIQQIMDQVLPEVLGSLVDPLPDRFARAHAMPTLIEAFRMIHQPQDEDQTLAARRRLAFNELLLLQLGIAMKRRYNTDVLQAPALHWSAAIDAHIRRHFPFELTPGQNKVIREMLGDLQADRPMNRLLQADVGAGKTVVALYAMLLAAANGKQALLMAPTELLADQHYLSISRMLRGSNVRVALLTASQSASGSRRRQVLLGAIAAGQYDLVIGTQALLSGSIRFKDLAVVVIDEQHRFGVMQRAALRRPSDRSQPQTTDANHTPAAPPPLSPQPATLPTAGTPNVPTSASQSFPASASASNLEAPHCLVMTATPIPRTLSLTLFGDLNVSVIDDRPPGRSPILTKVVPPEKSQQVYQFLAKRIAAGEQAYVVVPAIDDENSSELSDTPPPPEPPEAPEAPLTEPPEASDGRSVPDSADSPAASRINPAAAGKLKTVQAHADWLQAHFLPHERVAAIHGRMERRRRALVMERFRRGEIKVIVATTVVEVGMDVPNATVMIVEHAERFGLAQLHQLRGRIGRGVHEKPCVCVLIAQPPTELSEQRMKAIASSTDGFAIAELDWQIRGMGELFGTRQHGVLPLRIARLPRDMDLLQLAKRDAESIIADDPNLAKPQHDLLRKLLKQHYGQAIGLVDVG